MMFTEHCSSLCRPMYNVGLLRHRCHAIQNQDDHCFVFERMVIIMPPTEGIKGQLALLFSARLFICLSVCLSVCPPVEYIANNLRTQRPSVPKFGMKVPHLRCDSHTSFKVKRSKVRVTDGRGAYRTHYHQ